MKQSMLILTKNENGYYHTVFKNRHARKIYLAVSLQDGVCTVAECHYSDRSVKKTPKNVPSRPFAADRLPDVLANTLDKRFYSFDVSEAVVTKEELIAIHSSQEKKKILLLIRNGDVLRTIFKNKSHRTIFLEVKVEGNRGLIARCEYRDSRSTVMVFGLKTICFTFSLPALLEIVNTELEGGFTDIAVTEEHTLVLDRPICGRI